MTINIEKLLAPPRVDISLEELKVELNELAKLRQDARVAFCKRLAIVYMIIVGHAPPTKKGEWKKFDNWCKANLRTANNAIYSLHTLRGYVGVGFSKNPEATLERYRQAVVKENVATRKLGLAIKNAVREEVPPKVIPITRLKQKHGLSTNVAREVNALMAAWELASPEARAQFIYLVAGRRVAA